MPLDTPYQQIADHLEKGLSLREAADLEGADYPELRDLVVAGRTARRGTRTRIIYDAFRQAQAKHSRGVVALVTASAKIRDKSKAAGDAKSLQSLLARMEQNSIDRIRPVVTDPIGRKRQRLEEVRLAKESASGIAYTHLLKEERALEEELERAEQRGGRNPADYTPEEWVARLQADAREAPDCDLEVYALEWLRRIRNAVLTDTGARVRVDGHTVVIREGR